MDERECLFSWQPYWTTSSALPTEPDGWHRVCEVHGTLVGITINYGARLIHGGLPDAPCAKDLESDA